MTFGELRSGDIFKFPDHHGVLYAKVHQRYIQVNPRKIGSRSMDAHVPVELVSKAEPHEPKEIEL